MRRRKNNESGFAMLLVFLLAALIAISLYNEIPRVAFEAQRQKEQTLVDRGEQFKRAIQVFYLNNKRWPSKIEELENYQTRRFLRRRYKDPMTGKDEWRLIHIQNGVLTDSVTTKNQNQQQGQGFGPQNFINEVQGLAATDNQQANGVSLANRRRPSDGAALPPMGGSGGGTFDPNGGNQTGANGMPGTPGSPGMPGQTPPGAQLPPGMVGAPGYGGQPTLPGQTGQPGQTMGGLPPGATGIPGIPGVPGSGVPGAPGQNPQQGGATSSTNCFIGNCGATTTTPQQGYPGMPGSPVNSQAGGGTGQQLMNGLQGQGAQPGQFGGQPGQFGGQPGQFGQPGLTTGGQGGTQASNLIGQLLTSPRPGGLQGMPGQQVTTIGGGLAGVASTADAEGIMRYGDNRSNYKEWEYIFDLNKYKAPLNPLGGGVGTPANQVGTPAGGLNSPGQNGPGGFGVGGFGVTPNSGPGGAGANPMQGNTTPRGPGQ
jgi:hypothetical protein